MNKKCFLPANVLIPENSDMTRWSVVACDQYTSQPEYWEEVSKIVGDAPSTLKITLPEVYLEADGKEQRIFEINKTMGEYALLLKEYKNAFIYVERAFKSGKTRRGIVGMVDLLEYDFKKDSTSLIRATEGTVFERIPPRVAVRKDAPLEIPHIMLLTDNPEKTIIEPLADMKESMEKIYDFELMQGGGHIKGYLVPLKYNDKIIDAYACLADINSFNKKYSSNCKSPLLFAVGDGNHSLATAKTCYEKLKNTLSEDEYLNHPARFALAELCNLHDESLEFEAIHRVIFGVNAQNVIDEFMLYCKENSKINETQKFIFCYNNECSEIAIKNPPSSVAAGTLQSFLDGYIDKTGAGIDYIHGEEVTKQLGSRSGNLGIILETISKDSLFKGVALDGVLPRKTFSMGEACEKRYYLESRKIIKE